MTARAWMCDRGRVLAFGLAGVGAAVFWALRLPLPMLLGPMMACLLVALCGARLQGAGRVGLLMRTILGVAVGSSITPDIVGQLPDLAASLLLVPVFIGGIAALGYPLLRRGFGFDPATAWYGAMPGGLQDMMIFGEEAGGDPRALSLIHATRVLVIVTVAPLVMGLFWQVDLSKPPGAPFHDVPLHEIALMIAAGVVGWPLAERVGLFGASILGPLILATGFSLCGLITHRPPAVMIQLAQFFIGIAVGVKYSGITWKELRFDVGAGLAYALFLAVFSLGFIGAVVWMGLAPPLEGFLAFLPGGQAEMVVIAIIAGADLTYVVSVHLLRIVVVIVMAPVLARWVKGIS